MYADIAERARRYPEECADFHAGMQPKLVYYTYIYIFICVKLSV